MPPPLFRVFLSLSSLKHKCCLCLNPEFCSKQILFFRHLPGVAPAQQSDKLDQRQPYGRRQLPGLQKRASVDVHFASNVVSQNVGEQVRRRSCRASLVSRRFRTGRRRLLRRLQISTRSHPPSPIRKHSLHRFRCSRIRRTDRSSRTIRSATGNCRRNSEVWKSSNVHGRYKRIGGSSGRPEHMRFTF